MAGMLPIIPPPPPPVPTPVPPPVQPPFVTTVAPTESTTVSTTISTTVATLFCLIVKAEVPKTWERCTDLDNNGVYRLCWNPPKDTNNPNSEITFRIEAKAKGYVGMGLSPNGGMPGSDIFTGWIKNGVVYCQDRNAVAFSLPPRDKKEDYFVLDAYENDTHTVFVFKRKLDTCDEEDNVIYDVTTRVIFAFSNTDPEGEDPFYHRENRGSKSILLLQERQEDVDLSSMKYWDVKSPDIELGSNRTLYWCKIYKSPTLPEKNHMVYVQPLLQKNNERFMHHMVIYECVGGTDEQYGEFLEQRGHTCWGLDMPPKMFMCQGFFFSWAVGGGNVSLPQHVGMPLYPEGRFFMMEYHYDNPQVVTGIVDGSGLRFYYTDKLRPNDAGNLIIGANVLPRVMCPPGQGSYVVVGHSNDKCLGQKLPGGQINVFAVNPHSHLLGRQITLRHFDGNRELKPLVRDKFYDFNYQDIRMITDERAILRNHSLTTECVFNSTQRNTTTFGGLSTQEEMCVCFVLYYPKMNDSYMSLSGPTLETINELFNKNFTHDLQIPGGMKDFDWNSVDMKKVQDTLRYSKHDSKCFYGYYEFGAPKDLVSYPDPLIPYTAPPTCSAP